jgi:hypothetical protein
VGHSLRTTVGSAQALTTSGDAIRSNEFAGFAVAEAFEGAKLTHA